MSSSKFVSNLDGMNEGKNFGKDLLKVRKLLVSGEERCAIVAGRFLKCSPGLHFRVFTIL